MTLASSVWDAQRRYAHRLTSSGSSLAGIWLAIEYVVAGAILCITIMGIQFGVQAFNSPGMR